MSSGYQNFEQLEVWIKARALKKDILVLTKTFPSEEKFRLTDQLIRSSRSVNSQIAEGHGRNFSRPVKVLHPGKRFFK